MPLWQPPRALSDRLREDVQRKIDGKTKPLGSLGQLEEIAVQLALAQESCSPRAEHPQVLVFAADHGAARSGVSAYPSEVTAQMVVNFLAGGAAINTLAKIAGAPLRVVDAGVQTPLAEHPQLIARRIAPGTANYLEQPAMTHNQRDAALAAGQRIAWELLPEQTDILIAGEMGIGNSSSAALLTHCLTDLDLHTAVGPGTGLDEAGVQRKRAALQTAIARGGRCTDPLQALAEYGGFELAMMAGAMLGAAQRRIVTLVDGYIATAAALVVCTRLPALRPYLLFAHRSKEPGHLHVLQHLRARPILDLHLALGEGTGAALAYPIVRASAAFLRDMASFEDAKVSGALS